MAAAACPQRTFPNSPRLKRSLVYSPGMIGYTSSSTSSEVVTVPWLSVQTVFPMRRPLLTESPFASDGCYPTQGGVAHLLGEHYPSFIAPTGSCAGPRPSHLPRLSLRQWVFAGCSKSLLGNGPSRRYFRESFPRCLDLYPGGPSGAHARYFPEDIGLRHVGNGSALHVIRTATSVREILRGCSHSLMFRPPGLLATQIAPTAVQ